MPSKSSAQIKIYQIKVALLDITPSIWRRFQVQGDTTLPELHDILQEVMGWEDCHLHEFVVGDDRYGMPFPDGEDLGFLDESKMKLNGIARRKGSRFLYRYDFGDGWQHKLLVEKIAEPEKGVQYPTCLAGERACPPEDCGGAWGYPEFLEAIRDPKHPEHEEYLEWIGGEFDPEEFDRDLINEMLPLRVEEGRGRSV